MYNIFLIFLPTGKADRFLPKVIFSDTAASGSVGSGENGGIGVGGGGVGATRGIVGAILCRGRNLAILNSFSPGSITICSIIFAFDGGGVARGAGGDGGIMLPSNLAVSRSRFFGGGGLVIGRCTSGAGRTGGIASSFNMVGLLGLVSGSRLVGGSGPNNSSSLTSTSTWP